MTDLDIQLQNIASEDWSKFVDLIGEDGIRKAKICLMRRKKKSYSVIARKLAITYKQARYGCDSCDIPN